MRYFKSIDDKKVNEIKNVLRGLSQTEWTHIKGSIDMYFSTKAAKIKIDDLDILETLLKRK